MRKASMSMRQTRSMVVTTTFRSTVLGVSRARRARYLRGPARLLRATHRRMAIPAADCCRCRRCPKGGDFLGGVDGRGSLGFGSWGKDTDPIAASARYVPECGTPPFRKDGSWPPFSLPPLHFPDPLLQCLVRKTLGQHRERTLLHPSVRERQIVAIVQVDGRMIG